VDLRSHAPGTTHLVLDHTGFSGWNGFVTGTVLRFGWRSLLRKELAEVVTSAA
jgi:RNA:NAD 2'-phosphotransferase (TPT1/KptA family)